jgi:hypothetical protein
MTRLDQFVLGAVLITFLMDVKDLDVLSQAFSAGLITGPLDIVVIKTLALDKILRFENGPLREGSLND